MGSLLGDRTSRTLMRRSRLKCTSGPLPLARGGLGWGPSWPIAPNALFAAIAPGD
ncbi:hypothetical protein NG799_11630 [Laspinema sp. D1]|uniref:Uncharacterized protein n=1 Tax=Laspinema palackyanum D2a TaxID=2953684 RepID=A0ABT2MQG1_9CYAN|nr:hypothetical protein [Laspinema sp. D2a]